MGWILFLLTLIVLVVVYLGRKRDAKQADESARRVSVG